MSIHRQKPCDCCGDSRVTANTKFIKTLKLHKVDTAKDVTDAIIYFMDIPKLLEAGKFK